LRARIPAAFRVAGALVYVPKTQCLRMAQRRKYIIRRNSSIDINQLRDNYYAANLAHEYKKKSLSFLLALDWKNPLLAKSPGASSGPVRTPGGTKERAANHPRQCRLYRHRRTEPCRSRANYSLRPGRKSSNTVMPTTIRVVTFGIEADADL
jgi:hypothetical protein